MRKKLALIWPVCWQPPASWEHLLATAVVGKCSLLLSQKKLGFEVFTSFLETPHSFLWKIILQHTLYPTWEVVPLSWLRPTSALGCTETSVKNYVLHKGTVMRICLSPPSFVASGSCSCQCNSTDFCTSPSLASTKMYSRPHCFPTTSPATVSSTSRKSAKLRGFRSRVLVVINFRYSSCREMVYWLFTPNPLHHCALPCHLRGDGVHILRISWTYEEQGEQL